MAPRDGFGISSYHVRYADIQHTDFKVRDFLSWQRAGTLELSPSFQRRPVWAKGAKSFLIDTVVRGFPMPVVFLRNVPSATSSYEPLRQVVDGQQRIRTLISYVAPEVLPDFDPTRDEFTVKRIHNRELAGKPFERLDDEIRLRILEYDFSVHVFPTDTDDREILQVFARMNATGVKLSPQELRNAEFFGEFKSLMYDLGAEQLSRWRKWGVFTETNIARMEEVELTSEFAMLMLSGITKREQASITATYRRYDDEFPPSKEVVRRFHHVMDFIDENFDVRVTPFAAKALIYSLFGAVYSLLYGLQSPVERTSPNSIPKRRITWVREAAAHIEAGTAPDSVMEATARRTTDAGSRRRLVAYLTTD